ncbi:MAG: hypothetical protein ACE5K9_12645 [Candidatus Methylomirabilales bacterium]
MANAAAGALVLAPSEGTREPLRLLFLEPMTEEEHEARGGSAPKLLVAWVPDPTHLDAPRYQQELRPIVIGDPERHDRTLEMWIESYFPSRT